MSILVSIITPCYNSEQYLSRYLDSILKQTYRHIQQIIIDDGSTDNTAQIVDRFKPLLKDAGIELTYYRQENTGIGGAVNKGLKLVKGQLFTWCDSDNFYSPDYIEENVNYFKKHPEAAIVRCDGFVVLSENIERPIEKLSDSVKNKYEKHLFFNCLQAKDFYFGCTMLRTKSFDEVNPKREIYSSREGQNWQIMLPMFYHFDSYYIDKPMFYFVVRKDSISHNASQKGLLAQIDQNNECERIEEITVKSMGIPEEKQCLDIIHSQYSLIRFWLADKYQNKDILMKEYRFLKANGWVDEEVKKAVGRWSNPLWRFLQKMR
ncbi:MAG: glycosyltransferase family 2 protein [Erysipelotrichaceae bacterium]|nr:glycosyltransferase family 2 protein [Clostridia bacterium]MBQ6217762.1 glycosyltransferase family 2 protein [Erysipelotrichaceae bacterium]